MSGGSKYDDLPEEIRTFIDKVKEKDWMSTPNQGAGVYISRIHNRNWLGRRTGSVTYGRLVFKNTPYGVYAPVNCVDDKNPGGIIRWQEPHYFKSDHAEWCKL